MKKTLKVLATSVLAASLLAACGSKEEVEVKEPVASEKPVASDVVHPDYEKYKEKLEKLKVNTEKYKDINVALEEGYIPMSGYVPMMGYHFGNPNRQEFSEDFANTLLYVIEDGKYKLVGVEYGAVDPNTPTPIEGLKWEEGHPASAHYEDGSELPAASQEEALPVNPETNSKLVSWHPTIYGIHVWTEVQNPEGLFGPVNPELAKYSASPAQAPLEGYGIKPKQ